MRQGCDGINRNANRTQTVIPLYSPLDKMDSESPWVAAYLRYYVLLRARRAHRRLHATNARLKQPLA